MGSDGEQADLPEQPPEVQEVTNALMARLTLVVEPQAAVAIFRAFAEQYQFAALAKPESDLPPETYALQMSLPEDLDEFQRRVVVEALDRYTTELGDALTRSRLRRDDI